MTQNLPAFWTSHHLEQLCHIARAAGAVAMHHRRQGSEATHAKSDGSPVTVADHEAQQVILAGLADLTPDIPIVAEEKANPATLAAHGTYWLVDPLDGTRDYVMGGEDFSVNIGLLVDHQPLLGVLYIPAREELYYGEPATVFMELPQLPRTVLTPPVPTETPQSLRLITSQREARRLPVQDWVAEGLVTDWRVCSSAYKFGLLARGDANCFLRTGTTYEWDTAAGDAILRALSGRVCTLDGVPLPYGKPDYRNGNFIATLPGISQSHVDSVIKRTRAALDIK